MRHYRATNTETSEVIEYDAELPQQAHFLAPWVLEDVSVAAPSHETDPVTPLFRPQDWHITKRAFRNRFTEIEEVAIELAALDTPAAPMQARAFAAVLRSNQRKVSDSPFVDLKLQQTRDGVIGLEAAGLLATGRALVILDTLPTGEELFHG